MSRAWPFFYFLPHKYLARNAPLLSAGRRDAAVWTSRLRSGNFVWRHVLHSYGPLDRLPARFRADRSSCRGALFLLRYGFALLVLTQPQITTATTTLSTPTTAPPRAAQTMLTLCFRHPCRQDLHPQVASLDTHVTHRRSPTRGSNDDGSLPSRHHRRQDLHPQVASLDIPHRSHTRHQR
jgi:hypothetical protein